MNKEDIYVGMKVKMPTKCAWRPISFQEFQQTLKRLAFVPNFLIVDITYAVENPAVDLQFDDQACVGPVDKLMLSKCLFTPEDLEPFKMKDRILIDARFNTKEELVNGEPVVIKGYTDDSGQVWTKLNCYDDLLTIKDLLHPDWQPLLEEDKQQLTEEIAAGVTFGFYYRDEKLVYER